MSQMQNLQYSRNILAELLVIPKQLFARFASIARLHVFMFSVAKHLFRFARRTSLANVRRRRRRSN